MPPPPLAMIDAPITFWSVNGATNDHNIIRIEDHLDTPVANDMGSYLGFAFWHRKAKILHKHKLWWFWKSEIFGTNRVFLDCKPSYKVEIKNA